MRKSLLILPIALGTLTSFAGIIVVLNIVMAYTTHDAANLQEVTRFLEALNGLTMVAPWLVFAALFSAYMLPWLVAMWRRRLSMPIFIVNLFTGWTVIGWITALTFSLTPDPRRYHQTSP